MFIIIYIICNAGSCKDIMLIGGNNYSRDNRGGGRPVNIQISPIFELDILFQCTCLLQCTLHYPHIRSPLLTTHSPHITFPSHRIPHTSPSPHITFPSHHLPLTSPSNSPHITSPSSLITFPHLTPLACLNMSLKATKEYMICSSLI